MDLGGGPRIWISAGAAVAAGGGCPWTLLSIIILYYKSWVFLTGNSQKPSGQMTSSSKLLSGLSLTFLLAKGYCLEILPYSPPSAHETILFGYKPSVSLSCLGPIQQLSTFLKNYLDFHPIYLRYSTFLNMCMILSDTLRHHLLNNRANFFSHSYIFVITPRWALIAMLRKVNFKRSVCNTSSTCSMRP